MSKHIYEDGYVRVFQNGGQDREHIQVWEKYNGPLHEGCHIHHLDEDKLNNDISNLDMMSCNKHMVIHQGGMFIGGIWLHECKNCHNIILLDELPEHYSRHIREYNDDNISKITISEPLGEGRLRITTKIRYNEILDNLEVEQFVGPVNHRTKALFNFTPDIGITVHVSYTVTGAVHKIFAGWRDRIK